MHYSKKKEKVLSKEEAKKLCAIAAKKQRIRHQRNLNIKSIRERGKDSYKNKKSIFKNENCKINCVSSESTKNLKTSEQNYLETSEQNYLLTEKSVKSKENTVYPIQLPETTLKSTVSHEANSKGTKEVRLDDNCMSSLKSCESSAENTIHSIQVPEMSLKKCVNEEASSPWNKKSKNSRYRNS